MVDFLTPMYKIFEFFGISNSLANLFLFILPMLLMLALVVPRRRD